MRVLPALLVAVALGACAPSDGARTIEITIHHSRFSPGALEVAPGERVRFVIRNLDPIDHEFILGDDELQLRHETGTEPAHGAVPGEVSIPAVSEATTTYTFEGRGVLAFGCHLPGHWDYGMHGPVVVG